MIALNGHTRLAGPLVRQAARGGNGWLKHHFALVATELLNSEHRAVQLTHMLEQLDTAMTAADTAAGCTADSIVAALALDSVIALRPYSEYCDDIAEAAYGPQQDIVITACTPVHYYCMHELREKVSATPQQQQQLKERIYEEQTDTGYDSDVPLSWSSCASPGCCQLLSATAAV
jgi:hypothetical protein